MIQGELAVTDCLENANLEFSKRARFRNFYGENINRREQMGEANSMVSNSAQRRRWLWIALLIAAAVMAVDAALDASTRDTTDLMTEEADESEQMLPTAAPPAKSKTKTAAAECKWLKLRDIRRKREANAKSYKELSSKFKTASTPKARTNIRTKAGKLTDEYVKIGDQYAAEWKSCNAITEARLVTENNEVRKKSYEVTFAEGEISQDAVEEANKSAEKMREARKAYVKDASDNKKLSASDRKRIQKSVIPRVKQNITKVQSLVKSVTSQVEKLTSAAASATDTSGGFSFSALSNAVSNAADAVTGGGDLNFGKTLLSAVQDMLKGFQSLLQDAQTLAG